MRITHNALHCEHSEVTGSDEMYCADRWRKLSYAICTTQMVMDVVHLLMCSLYPQSQVTITIFFFRVCFSHYKAE